MKKIFRKAVTVLGSTAMIGATIGAAAAASYPAPFTSNTAIVTGANAAPSDSIAAASIASNLNAASAGSSVGGSTTVTGGDSYKFEKTSTKFHVGDTITGVISSTLDDDELPNLLAEGEFTDDDNDDFDFTQEITMGALQLTMFEDNDYKEDEPTLGFRVASGTNVLTYELEFTDEPSVYDLETADMMLMGREYYVLDYTNSTTPKLTLLDSAADTILAEGETTTLNAGGKAYTVSINFISSNEVILTVNGENTNSLAEAETFKLADDVFIGVKDILFDSKDAGISKVEFSVGSGKLVIEDGQEVELNDDDNVDGLVGNIAYSQTSSDVTLSNITLVWTTDEDEFITTDRDLVLPGFGTVKLSYGGADFPAEEEIEVSHSGDDEVQLNSFPFKDGTEDIDLLYKNSTGFIGLGKDSDNRLITGNDSITFDDDTDDYFIGSWSDNNDAESYMMRATNFQIDGSTNETTIEYKKNGQWVDAKKDASAADTFSIGNSDFLVGAINKADKTVVISANNAETNFHTLYSKEGLKMYLPQNVSSALPGFIDLAGGPSSFDLVFDEEDKDGDIADGKMINVTLGLNAQSPTETTVSGVTLESGSSFIEVDDSDVFRAFSYSDLATEIHFDKGPDQQTATLFYHGDEVANDVYITSSEAVVVGGSSGDSGVMSYTDAESSSFSGMNLVVVGGSAINSVAAELLGGSFSGDAFSAATGVSAGQFLIQSFDRNGNTALLVAGYNAADTEKATTYLLNNDVDTAVGNKYMGTSSTEATLTVA